VREASLETGLRHRLRRVVRQIREQHHQLAPLARELAGALAGGAAAEPGNALARYREALGAHFSLESEVFFPALHGLRPERAAELEALEREHEGLLADLRGALRAGGPGAGPPLEAFFAALGAHERREEGLAAELAEGEEEGRRSPG
jgi:hypothetical protein